MLLLIIHVVYVSLLVKFVHPVLSVLSVLVGILLILVRYVLRNVRSGIIRVMIYLRVILCANCVHFNVLHAYRYITVRNV